MASILEESPENYANPAFEPDFDTRHSNLVNTSKSYYPHYEPSVVTNASSLADDVESQLKKKCDDSPTLVRIKRRISNLSEAAKLPTIEGTNIQLKYIILDFSCVSYLDTDGINLIAKLAKDLKEIQLKLLIAQANVTVSKNLAVGQKRLKVSHEIWPKIFVTIDAAVNHLLETSSIYRNSGERKIRR